MSGRRRIGTSASRDGFSTASNSSAMVSESPVRTESISSCASEMSQSEGWNSDSETASVQVSRSEERSHSITPGALPQALEANSGLGSPTSGDINIPETESDSMGADESDEMQAMNVTESSSLRDAGEAVWLAGSMSQEEPLQRPEKQMTWVQPSLRSSRDDDAEELAGTSVLHQISSQPWEIQLAAPSTVVGDAMAVFGQARGFAGAAGGAAAGGGGSAIHTGSGSASAVSSATVPGTSSTFGAALLPHGGFSEDLRDFGVDLGECPSLRGMKPSLTREVSLVRAVEALGGEHSTQGMSVHDAPGFVW